MNLVQLKSGLFVPDNMEKKALSSIDDSRYWQVLYDYGTSMSAWQKDITIDRDAVMANWTVFACMTLIASDIGKCNLRLMMKDGDIWTETESPSFSPVLKKPNAFQTRQQFMESWMISKLSWGNTYALKRRDNRGIVTHQYILDPCRVQPLISDNGDVFYRLNRDDISRVPQDYLAVPASEIIHDRFNCLYHPLVGLSPILANGLAATQGLKIQTNSAKFFDNMSRPSGILVAPGPISQSTADTLKEKWDSNYSGEKIGKIAVIGDGMKFESMAINAVDSQLAEQFKLSAEVICSTFHVPPFKVGVGTIPPGKVEELNQIYYTDCLHTLMDAIQTLETEGLGLDVPKEGRQYAVQFDLDDLLKMDSQTLISVIRNGVDGSIVAPNEGRRRLNLPPVSGGEAPLSQQQYYSLEALAKRDAKPDPFASDSANEPSDGDDMEDAAKALASRLQTRSAKSDVIPLWRGGQWN